MFKIHVHIRNPKKPQLPSEIHNEISNKNGNRNNSIPTEFKKQVK